MGFASSVLAIGFILLTSPNGNLVYFNTEAISAVHDGKNTGDRRAGAMISMTGGHQYYVLESPTQVVEKIREAQNK